MTARLIAWSMLVALFSSQSWAEVVWIEGENPSQSAMTRHPWWYDKVKKDQLSGGDFISHFDKEKVGEAEYAVKAAAAGPHEFWVRANPIQSSLKYKLNDGEWTAIPFDGELIDSTNIAEDDKPDLRFVAWVKVAKLALNKGENKLRFRMDSTNNNHGMLDCFVLVDEDFKPRGIMKPDAIAAADKQVGDWFAFAPKPDPFDAASSFDLRSLNETEAGDGGFIAARGLQFIHGKTGEPVRFWAVNGPPGNSRDELLACGRMLAKHGVNMVRIHGGYFNEAGEVDPAKVKHAIDIVETMKPNGIYSHFSIYFPLWLNPKPATPWLSGYDGKTYPFAALYFNKDFQERYRGWWKALLLTPGEKGGKRLVDDPAVAGLEIINEDSYFFWTFNTAGIPDEQLKIIETQFGDWLKKKYGSIDAATKNWGRTKVARDNPAAGRIGFRGHYDLFTQKTPRDRDTVAFLLDSQRTFYQQTYDYLRSLGFKGVICASNWATASPQVLGPLEKYSYTVGDFIDRHGYFGCRNQGDNSAWSLRDGQTYVDRSALRFEAEEPGKPKQFVNPVMDPSYDNKPSMISETTFTRPNRYRSEAPLFYACYGALQDSDCIVHFALDGANWTVKPNFFMQPWTVMSPAMMGQFPAAAMVYRKGLVASGDLLADVNLNVSELTDLKGTPLPQDAAFDELRLKDVPQGTEIKAGNVIDPLIHFAGRTNVNFIADGKPSQLKDLSPFIDRKRQRVTSTTNQLMLDYGKGVLTINAPAAQGVSGNLKDAGTTTLADLEVTSDLALGHIIAVSLDGQPIASSKKILLQVMSEEKASYFRSDDAAGGVKKIVSIGQDPWMVKSLSGTVKFKRADAGNLKVTPLDFNGYPQKPLGAATEIKLAPNTIYYLISG